MAFSGEVRRLEKLAREVLFREILCEHRGDSELVLGVIDGWRLSRKVTDPEMEHYALTTLECNCSVCSHVHQVLQLVRTEIPSQLEAAGGETWVGEMISLLDRRAPGMTPAQFKKSMRFRRAGKDWTDEETLNYIQTAEVPHRSVQYFRTTATSK